MFKRNKKDNDKEKLKAIKKKEKSQRKKQNASKKKMTKEEKKEMKRKRKEFKATKTKYEIEGGIGGDKDPKLMVTSKRIILKNSEVPNRLHKLMQKLNSVKFGQTKTEM